MTMNVVDLVCVASIVVGAVAFIGARFRSPRSGSRRAPACHQTGAPLAGNDDAPQVVLGASLAKGLQKAQRRARSSDRRVNA